jgi:hypothetical protein
MKSYTDIEQSKKLSEFLPLESADMRYSPLVDNMHPWVWTDTFLEKDAIPCWSLAALINSVKYNTINLHYNDVRNDWIVSCTIEHSTRYESERALNPIDAIFEMIIKLYQQKLL